jgi:hypothetical protein
MPDVMGALALPCPLPPLHAMRRLRMRRNEAIEGTLFCRSELARDRLAWLFLGFVQMPEQELSSRPSGAPSHFSLLAHEPRRSAAERRRRPEGRRAGSPPYREVTKRKGTPASRPPGILPCGYAIGLRGFADSASCAARTRAPPCARPFGPDAAPARRLAGAPLRGHRGRAEPKPAAPTPRHEDAPARGAAPQQRKRNGARIPYVAPSSAGSRRGKAWMFERMDARVHAGRRVPSNAGHGARAASDARQPGRLSLGYFSLARRAAQERGRTPKAARRAAGRMPAVQREVTRDARRAARKPLLRLLIENKEQRSQAVASKLAPTGKAATVSSHLNTTFNRAEPRAQKPE